MENLLSQFNADNLEIKLTSEKIFINTAISTETFALRSINGIGVVDLVEEYNKALTTSKSLKDSAFFAYFIAVSFLIGAIYFFSNNISGTLSVFFLVISFLLFFWGYNLSKTKEPSLMSAVRIMMSGGNRDFQFDKTGSKSGNIAEFVAEVENTLTSYHKNNG